MIEEMSPRKFWMSPFAQGSARNYRTRKKKFFLVNASSLLPINAKWGLFFYFGEANATSSYPNLSSAFRGRNCSGGKNR